MTTIAVLNGTIAADTQETWQSEGGGTSKHRCTKLFRKKVPSPDNPEVLEEVIIGLAGSSFPGLVFLDWYGTNKDIPDVLTHGVDADEDFDAVILTSHGVYFANRMCRPVKAEDEFIAVGSGRKAAIAVMTYATRHGIPITAAEAVEVATGIDPYTSAPIVTMTLDDPRPRKHRRRRAKPLASVEPKVGA